MKRLLITALLFTSTAYGQTTTDKFRFTTDYFFLDLKGNVDHREQVVGTYSRNWIDKQVQWTDVTVAASKDSAPDLFGPPEKQTFMEGFSYPLGPQNTTDAAFFQKFPPNATQQQSLVWDSQMFEIFGEEHFDNLKSNVTYHLPSPTSIPLAGAGNFQNKDVQLMLSGTAKCDNQECSIIDYQAFFNTFELKLSKETLKGRSHYWGQIWVSLATKRILRATVYEDVLGEVEGPNLPRPVPVNVFRIGVFETVKE